MLPRTPGSFTFTGDALAITWTTGNQGIMWGNTTAAMFHGPDLLNTMGAVALNQVVDFPFSNTIPTSRRLFWTTKVTLKCSFTNQSQNDCVIIAYPWIARYSGTTAFTAWASPDSATTATEATSSTLESVHGATPFNYVAVTQSSKIMKPQTAVLQGGQHKTFSMVYRKRHMWNLASLEAGAGGSINGSYAGITRGFAFTFRGRVNNGVTNPTVDIGYGSGKVIYTRTLNYEYESCAMPIQWRDTEIVAYTATGGEHIILPQTGAVAIPTTA